MAASFLDEWLDARADARYNLGESGIADIRLDQIIPAQDLSARLAHLDFEHNDTRGSFELRSEIAKLYDHAEADNVLVTAGITEALLVYLMDRMQPGANVVVLTPAFHNLYDLPGVLGYDVRRIALSSENNFNLPLDEVVSACDAQTRAVLLTTPGNPTGTVITPDEISNLADRLLPLDCDIVLDEQYRLLPYEDGTERLASMANHSARIVGLGSAGKCYGTVGLRVGWAISSPARLASMNAVKALTSHAVCKLNDAICVSLLREGGHIIAANRATVRANSKTLEQFVSKNHPMLSMAPPAAGTVAFPRLTTGISSIDFGEKLYREHDVLVLPGEAFDMPGFFRVRLGLPAEEFNTALGKIELTLGAIQA
ncbi:MAG: aminotransferase class I/II-fold pyridoxal phosphate-dependent enzyme [Anderseniella sp.]